MCSRSFRLATLAVGANTKRNSLALAVLTGHINPKTSVSWCLWTVCNAGTHSPSGLFGVTRMALVSASSPLRRDTSMIQAASNSWTRSGYAEFRFRTRPRTCGPQFAVPLDGPMNLAAPHFRTDQRTALRIEHRQKTLLPLVF
jgi:hypothetical protein